MKKNISQPPASSELVRVECLSRDEKCPICGGDNRCRVAKGQLYKGPCWCEEVVVPVQILRLLAADRTESSCLCRSCLETAARLTHELDEPSTILSKIREWLENSRLAAKEEDWYLEENGKVVFTAAYHLRRGTCCANGCRHCPF